MTAAGTFTPIVYVRKLSFCSVIRECVCCVGGNSRPRRPRLGRWSRRTAGGEGAQRSRPGAPVALTCGAGPGLGRAGDVGAPRAVFLSLARGAFIGRRVSEDTGGLVGRAPCSPRERFAVTLDLRVSILMNAEDSHPTPVSSTLTFPQTSESGGGSSWSLRCHSAPKGHFRGREPFGTLSPGGLKCPRNFYSSAFLSLKTKSEGAGSFSTDYLADDRPPKKRLERFHRQGPRCPGHGDGTTHPRPRNGPRTRFALLFQKHRLVFLLPQV